ncbi:Putative 8-oxo-dGTP diphosphatase [Halomicronema hongdechloris C2206]|uniref:8-oxo-dGTP diphosphatase n=1 Tax=Halomicronema hongdechloris C2206 TaxID=1641165 RepID=A0A1Z3HTS0_9CYAN|nr:NUDIX hydrolase [Halomicronema hongdechloris]ASC73656.1 Putative 8-oxo-dGTP diphosphatase [Halomicronema hongdechloris C2206]
MGYLWHPIRVLLGLLLRRPILGTSVIPLLPSGEIVLVRRRDSGRWGLPGGFVDWGEDIVTAARRELAEETGLSWQSLERLVGIYSHPWRDPRFHSVCVALSAQVTGMPQVNDPREILEVRAFSPSRLPLEHLSHDHHRQLQDYFAGAIILA